MAADKHFVCGGESVLTKPFMSHYEVQLRVLTPTFIGMGKSVTRSEYLWDYEKKQILMPDLQGLLDLLLNFNIEGEYSKFISKSNQTEGLMQFLLDHYVPIKRIRSIATYALSMDTLPVGKKRKADFWLFMKGHDGLPYIPGSSLKGAIRTAILSAAMNGRKDMERHREAYEECLEGYEKCIDYKAKKRYNLEKKLHKTSVQLETELLNTLGIEGKKVYKEALVNDCLRGIQISDSRPISLDSLILCSRHDVPTKNSKNQLKDEQSLFYRECLKPDTIVRFVLTLDNAMLQTAGLNVEAILKALNHFAEIYETEFESHFPKIIRKRDERRDNEALLLLGGGVGFVSKTLVYPLMDDHKRAVRNVSRFMVAQYPKEHRHDKDQSLNISPHMAKRVYFNGQLEQMGRCAVQFVPIVN